VRSGLRATTAVARPAAVHAEPFSFAGTPLDSAGCMVMKAPSRSAVLLFAAGAVVGCQGGPSLKRSVTIETGKRTSITLLQVQGHMLFSLHNESGTDAAAVYSDEQANPLAKVVSDAHLQALLDVFTEKGLFEQSLATAPPDARDVLTVEHDGHRWIWARRRAGIQADEVGFHEAKNYFLEVYNSGTAYHRGGAERPDLKAERSRVRESSEAARQKLEDLQGRRK
jgi:hypothetical protein